MAKRRMTMETKSENLDENEQPKSERLYSGIDLDAIEAMAEEVDRTASVPIQGKPKRGKKKVPLNFKGTDEGDGLDEDIQDEEDEPEIEYDPEFEIMLSGLVSDAVDACRASLDWSDPGMHWRQKVGGCIARIIQKRLPVSQRIPDELVLLGYLLIWIVPNAAISRNGNGTGADKDSPRNDG